MSEYALTFPAPRPILIEEVQPMTELQRLERRLIAAQLARDHTLAAELAEEIERLRDKEKE